MQPMQSGQTPEMPISYSKNEPDVPTGYTQNEMGPAEVVNVPKPSEHKLSFYESQIPLISSLRADILDGISRYNGNKDYLVKLRDNIVNYNLIEYVAEGSFKLVYKTNILVKNKLNQEIIQPIVFALSKDPKSVAYTEKMLMLYTAKTKVPGNLPNYGLMHNARTGEFILITKFCNKGTLNNCFQTISLLDDKKKVQALTQCWKGIANLHKADISHRDVKCSNFLVNENSKGELKFYLGDVGLGCVVNSKLPKGSYSNLTLLPPFVKGLSNPKYDNFAFGLMICELMRKSNPDLAFDSDAVESKDVMKALPWLKYAASKSDPQKLKEVKDQIAEFIEETFNKTSFFADPHKNHALKHIVLGLMKIDPDQIMEDRVVFELLTHLNV